MSDIRKIQTGNNQYTLHARVSDKLAIMCSSKTRNNINYPFHRILKTDVYSNNAWVNHGITLYLSGHYASPSARFGIVDIEFSQNGASNSAAKITWIVRSGFEIDDVQAGLYAPASGTYIDVYLKTRTAYDGVAVKCISEGDWVADNLTYKFVNSEEVNNTTATNKLTSYEVYKTIEEAATQLHGKAYTSIIKPTDSGTVENAGYAEKVGTYKSHPQIGSSTKPVYVDNSGLVRACSREIPTGMTIDSVLNDTSVNAVLNKVINAALKGKNPKAKADFIASSDLTALPITAGVLDLNGYTLTLSGTTELTDTLTIKNGTIGGEGTLKNNLLISINDCLLITNSKITLSCVLSLLDDIHVTDPNGNFFVFNTGEDYYATISPSSYCRITNFSGITIEGTNIELDIVVQNGTNLLIKNAKIKVLDVVAVEFLGKFDAEIYNCHMVDLESSNVDKSSTYTVVSSDIFHNTGTSISTSFIRYGTKDQNGVLQDLLKPTSTINEDKYSVVSPKAVYDYLKNYARKDDISAVYKYKGTKTNYSELPTSGNNIGDVWNITNADAEHGIKAGDNVAWNGTAWDNLSGTVDLSAYATTTTTNAISADVKKLMDKAFPFTVNVSIDKTLAKKGTSQPVKVTITPKIGDDNTKVDEIMINGAEHHGATPYVYSATATTTTTYNVRVSKEGKTAQGSATITFVNPSYDGAVAANFTATETNIKALTETLRSGKGGTRTFNLNNQKACIAYPKAFGAATGINDANGFDYLASYTRSELNVNGELYYVYLMTNATTITDFKQIIN